MERHTCSQQGFTLIELMITVSILGAIFAITGPIISSAFTMMEGAKRDEVLLNNQKLAAGMMSYARNSNGGRLPPHYTGNGIRYGLYNPEGNADLSLELRNTGVPVNAINTDGSALENVKVYQVVSDLDYVMPFYGTTGAPVTLRYDVGSITQTLCAKSGSCNTGKPGASAVMSKANNNVASWMPTPPDYGAVVFSTLPEQKEMLRLTVARVNRLSDRLTSEFYTRMRLASADSTSNFYPAPSNSGAPNLSGRNPGTNMGCHDGWYTLSATNVNVLAQMGMDRSEYGVTAWGGPIAYCRDYEPGAASTVNAGKAPHYSALRLARNLSSAADTASLPENQVVIITF
ncbi:type II secretion system protein [Stutzerimonas stutzeri]|uniref:type II secretion system protein n=1 Tax=Stutzerimonas stutzeri TaxID=316 RepID=UPI00265CE0C0|nr:type II secretion system protein [Stutzerimonas stutzeri]MCF6783437.1 type II secretion system GspH family protein [Stutzerimonas stutzeri]